MNKVSLVFLAGGNSSRMGKDKGTMLYNGKPQVNRVAQMAKNLHLDFFVSCSSANQSLYADFNCILDVKEFENSGPISGVISALKYVNTPCLIVGCDYPFVTQNVLSALICKFDWHYSAVAYSEENSGRMEPLIAIYNISMMDVLADEILHGNGSLQKCLKGENTRILQIENMGNFRSIDTYEQYLEAKNKSLQ